MTKTTELSSNYHDLETWLTIDLLNAINKEDQTVPLAVEKCLPKIEQLVEACLIKLKQGGRLFYLGSGTSGRLGIVDASECPPTFGVPFDLVNGIIAGGDYAIRKARENAEDDTKQGFKDLKEQQVSSLDFVIGISASGSTPYVLGALKDCKENGIQTGCVVCNGHSLIAAEADFPIEVITGPEFVTGSTRMKAGTAQKLVLNMITTSLMIRLGRIKDNKMVDMQLTNAKLVERGIKMIMDFSNVTEANAKELLMQKGSVRSVLKYLKNEKE